MTFDDIRRIILEFTADFTSQAGEADWWRTPLAAAAPVDERFQALKTMVDDEHLLPRDLLPGAASVICYFLPFKKDLVKSNLGGTLASRFWGQSYVDTNRLVALINEHLSEILKKEGALAAVTPATHNFKPEKLISGWSHKHVAYLTGLGKFGVHTQVITPEGCCGRFGSLVVDLDLDDHPLMAKDEEACLVKRGRKCLACVKKCSFGALTEEGFDRFVCYDQLMVNDAAMPDLPLTDVCAKCVTLVPCSFRIPEAE